MLVKDVIVGPSYLHLAAMVHHSGELCKRIIGLYIPFNISMTLYSPIVFQAVVFCAIYSGKLTRVMCDVSELLFTVYGHCNLCRCRSRCQNGNGNGRTISACQPLASSHCSIFQRPQEKMIAHIHISNPQQAIQV